MPKVDEANTLPENKDVLEHKEKSNQVWDAKSEEYVIQTKELTKVYRGSSGNIAAVNNNSFCVKKGEILGLLGPNGAGKTSTFDILTLALQRSSGDSRIFGTPIDGLNNSIWMKDRVTMGMCPQHNTIWDALTVD